MDDIVMASETASATLMPRLGTRCQQSRLLWIRLGSRLILLMYLGIVRYACQEQCHRFNPADNSS